MSTSQAQKFVNRYGARRDLSRFLDGQYWIERDECPIGSHVCWFFPDGSIIWNDGEDDWEVIDGTPTSRGVGA
jgi:hypothetical protein